MRLRLARGIGAKDAAKKERKEALEREREDRQSRLDAELKVRAEHKCRQHEIANTIERVDVQTRVEADGRVAVTLAIIRPKGWVSTEHDAGLLLALDVQPIDQYDPDAGARVAASILTLPHAVQHAERSRSA